ncbi:MULTISPECIES: hypothetical protein [unclassified Streptomyces]|uniref:hypothetical protein n=1 Tax=unclassified Streptomyces TaxID=2593676 RepID=UPI002DD92DE1|nr:MULTISPECIES: hypothetical protein [unclassified Streptomyces]WSA92864.1 hypothetical protein OIE63_15775 [Streptomyces sp. NBC_01795]WSB77233.1 hypothetical protein OHB04_16610 [Streptomyces sp. NBC_01775]WSS14502.1 hypothetical protein OG533_23360 [Streptomyces sp. NBC_01186]WSS43319.1 hypothetical protein OG220_24040 [Streptomyces sp. NBC_01187]
MSYPPPPGQNPNNPYAAPQQGAPYGYPQQSPPPQYGYPQQGGMPAYPGAAYPGGPMARSVSMPGQLITARVLLFFAGSLWGLFSLFPLIGGLAAGSMLNDLPGVGSADGAAVGIGLLFFLLLGGLAALHIVPAAMFGKGGIGTRVTAIIAASINALCPLLGVLGALGSGDAAVGQVFAGLLWLATAVLTIVFCSLNTASQWFNRPRH